MLHIIRFFDEYYEIIHTNEQNKIIGAFSDMEKMAKSMHEVIHQQNKVEYENLPPIFYVAATVNSYIDKFAAKLVISVPDNCDLTQLQKDYPELFI